MSNEDLKSTYKKDQKEFYLNRFNDFGLLVQADGWTSENMAHYYYENVLDILSKNNKDFKKKMSILEVGSGHGFFYKYLEKKMLVDKFLYSGIEISDESFKQAQIMNPDAEYHCGDFLDYRFPELNYDYIIFLGTFSILVRYLLQIYIRW